MRFKWAVRITISFITLYIGAILTTLILMPSPLFDAPCSTIMYSADGELLCARIADDGQWRFPECDSLPQKYIDCIVQYEDKRFWAHQGIDIMSVIRAAKQNLQAGHVVEGGSTITMQVARIARGNQPRTLFQKCVELLWAQCIEAKYSKDEILRLHASHAPFGGNVVGAETAAWRYFGRDLHNLSWAEYATLAVLPNSPSLIHPGRNRDALMQKRNHLLDKLCEGGFIDSTELELSKEEPLPDAPHPLPNDAPHLLTRITNSVSGKRTQTTINSDLQRNVQRIANKYAEQYSSNYINNIAVLVAESESGNVVAYVGNTTGALNGNGNQVDIITSPRSTGSVLKPFLYAAMLTDGQILPKTLIPDVPLNINGFTPQNYTKKFYGSVPADVAIERSLNVPLVRMLSMYNTGRFMSVLKELGMTTLKYSEDHYGASIILGGAEGTLWDMCGMYASLSRQLNHYRPYGGKYNPADIHPLRYTEQTEQKPITPITDSRLHDSNLLSAASIWFTFEAMSNVNRPEEEADWQQFRSMKKIAWKTGTSFGGRDAWALGTTPQYTVGVWIGNANGEGRNGLTGVGFAAPVMFETFALLAGNSWFEMPLDDMDEATVCHNSGHLASDICTDIDSVFIPHTNATSRTCPYHHLINLSTDGKWRVNSSCESVYNMRTESWFVLPPSQEYYYKQYNIHYKPLPPYRAGCASSGSDQIDIIYPEHNTTIFLPKDFDGTRESVIMKAAHSRANATLYWHVDDNYFGATNGTHQMPCSIEEGEHRLTIVDEAGNRRSIMFTIKR
ncbi:MAG: penicillin-binding protein 1C [Bacteroidales bacterium]|nr:penicillin-binding protein 1C [Bacteroidales bacterium]